MEHTVLTVKQPLASLICSGIKDIENRTWKLPKKYKGERILIHASATSSGKPSNLFSEEFYNFLSFEFGCPLDFTDLYSEKSAIIGSVEIVDCVVNHPSIWAKKYKKCDMPTKCERCDENKHKCIHYKKPTYNWMLANPILFKEPIMNVKGKLGLWKFETDKILK